MMVQIPISFLGKEEKGKKMPKCRMMRATPRLGNLTYLKSDARVGTGIDFQPSEPSDPSIDLIHS